MNKYELKQAQRKQRFEALAEKNRAESDRLYDKSTEAVAHIPLGQPILVGHHSEKRHRNTLEKCHRYMEASVAANKKAEYYEQRAEGTNLRIEGFVISSDDEDAVKKLKAKLEKMQAEQEKMKAANRATPKGQEKPYPSFSLQNNNANMRRVAQRIAVLEREKAAPEKAPVYGNGYKITENKEDNRIWVEFDQKPSADVCKIMRRHGFKWSPSRMAWVRQLNNAGRYAAKGVMDELKKIQE